MKDSSFWHHVFIGLIGSTAGRIVTLISLAVGAKYFFSPEDIGYWGALFAIAMFLAPLTTFRYELSVVLPPSDEDAKYINLGIMLLVLVATLLLTALTVFLPAELITSLLSSHELVFIIPALIFFQNIRKGAEYWLVRIKQFRSIAFLDFGSALLMAVFTLGAGYFLKSDIKNFSLASFFAITISSLLYLYCGNRFNLFSGIKPINLKHPVKILSSFSVYPKYVTPYSLSLGLNQHAFTLALSFFYGLATTGAFVVAYRLVFAPVLLLITPLRQVFFSPGKTNDGNLTSSTKDRLVNILSLLVWTIPPLAISASAFVGYGVVLLFGAEYQEAAAIASIVVYAAFANIVTGWMDRIYDLLGRQRLSVAMQISADLLIFCTVILLMASELSSVYVVFAFTLLMIIYEFIWLLVTLRISEISWETTLKFVAILLITSLVFYFISLVLNHIFGDGLTSVLILLFTVSVWCVGQLFYRAARI